MENAQSLDVTELSRRLPRGSRVVVTDVGDAARASASRVEVCFPLEERRRGTWFVVFCWTVLIAWGCYAFTSNKTGGY